MVPSPSTFWTHLIHGTGFSPRGPGCRCLTTWRFDFHRSPVATAGRRTPSSSSHQELGDHCLLVGGQMVFLLEVNEAHLTPDPRIMSTSWSICGWNRQARPSSSTLRRRRLRPSAPQRRRHRSSLHTRRATIDVLAPDQLGSRPVGARRWPHDRGTRWHQALVRSSVVKVELTDGSTARVRRPTMVALPRQGRRGDADRCPDLGRRAKHVRDVSSLARLLGRRYANRRLTVRTVRARANSRCPTSTRSRNVRSCSSRARHLTATDAVRRAARRPRTFARSSSHASDTR